MLDRKEIAQSTGQNCHLIPSPADVRAALERIIASPEFRASPHLAAFLKYSVETTLAGAGVSIKAYSVATSVLGRPPTFDPQTDPIVRVEATRLRRAIERYYLHDGFDDPIRIDIPRGRYVAYFSYQAPPSEPDEIPNSASPKADQPDRSVDLYSRSFITSTFYQSWKNLSRGERRSVTVFAYALIGALVTWTLAPIISETTKPIEQAFVLQPANLSQPVDSAQLLTSSTNSDESSPSRVMFAMLQLTQLDSDTKHPDAAMISHRLTQMIAGHAAEYDGIPVIDPYGPMVADLTYDHLYALMGSVFQSSSAPERYEISVRLVHRPSYEIIWTRAYQIDPISQHRDNDLADISADIIRSTAGLHGAIRTDDARRHFDAGADSSSPCQLCLANSDLALRTGDPELVAKSISCLTYMTSRRPNEPLLFKQLSALNMTNVGKQNNDQHYIDLSVEQLKIALALEPQNSVTASLLSAAKQQQKELRAYPIQSDMP